MVHLSSHLLLSDHQYGFRKGRSCVRLDISLKNVEESKDNPVALFRLTRNMMGNSGETIHPLHTCKRNMANDFSAFCYNTILNIRSELGLPGLYKCGSMTTPFSGTPLTTIMDATEVEIQNIN